MINKAELSRIKGKLSLVDMCESGFWFCAACQHITELNTEGAYNACVICGSPRVRFCPPAFLPDPKFKKSNENVCCPS